MATITITEDKKKRVTDLIKSYRAIDGAIQPFQDQRKELRTEYIENQWFWARSFVFHQEIRGIIQNQELNKMEKIGN